MKYLCKISIFDLIFIFDVVAGLGFGFMSGLFAMVNILADTSGPGTLGLNGGHDPSFAVVSGNFFFFNLVFSHRKCCT